MFACESSTPLGVPVVPDVYISIAGVAGSSGGKSCGSPAPGSNASPETTRTCAGTPVRTIADCSRSALSGATKTTAGEAWRST